ncbi:clarin-3 [Falco naumanni]|uniref:Clarin 3 n=1 Tax=Falco tinnunculus TaxID=100819 RepID=A0A8C4UYX0_FALTI|nr:clarin-3 [Falco peregrinus]XP_005439285.1 clarin-3 [Falco cherrug]XP_037256067.1 clarin-3 [Falco rusticolus]XP_040462631.1 clarin-3 [Falco naumanni]
MPSRRKTATFTSAFFTCLCSFVMICVVLATQHWMSSEIRFSGTNSSVTISLTYGLFSGTCEQFVDVGLQISEKTFQVADNLSNTKAKSMITAIIVILVLGLLSSLLSSGFTCTNAVSNPYQTFLGATGIYTWNSLCGIFILTVMILFPVSIEENGLSVELANGCFSFLQTHTKSVHTYGYSYWIMLLIIFLNIASIIIIYFYDHARYSKKKEQERPIENAPKDVILF